MEEGFRTVNITCPTCHSPLRVNIVWITSGEYLKGDTAIECTNWDCQACFDDEGNEILLEPSH